MSWDDLQYAQTTSIENIRKLLQSIIASPSKYIDNKLLSNSLTSQASVAKINLTISAEGESLVIKPMSLNTFKTRCEEKIPDGFAGMDALRKVAIRALAKTAAKPTPKNNRSRLALKDKVSELELSLDMHKRSNLVLLQTLSDVRSKIDGVAGASDELTRTIRASEIIKRITAITSLNPEIYQIPAIRQAKVVSILSRDNSNE